MKIAYYISNHGFGHATRSAALIQEFDKLGIYTYICTNRPKYIFHKISKKNSYYKKTKLDFGVFQKDLFTPDLDKTENELIKLWDKKEEILQKEVDYFQQNKIDLIVADVPPFSFEIGQRLNIPVIAVSNFDWYFVYDNLFKMTQNQKIKKIIAEICDLQQKAKLAIRLPFSDKQSMQKYPQILDSGILAQKSNDKKKYLIDKYNLDPSKKMILVGFGGYGENPISKVDMIHFRDFTVFSKYDFDNGIKIHPDTDYQMLLSSVDIVITKVGYSTLAEAVQYGKYIVATARENYPEDIVLVEELLKYPNQHFIEAKDFQTVKWDEILSEAKNHEIVKLDKYENNNFEISSTVIESFFDNKRIVTLIIVGSNNIQFVWVYKDHIFHEATIMTGLGKNFDNNKLYKPSIERTQKVMDNIIATSQVFSEKIEVFGTGVSREATNIHLVSRWLKEKFDLNYHILSANRESYYNALANIDLFENEKFFTFDLGGLSTEFSYISNGNIELLESKPIGILRFFQKGISAKEVKNILDKMKLEPPKKIVGIGGTVCSIAAILLNQSIYNQNEINGYAINLENLKLLINKIEKLSQEDVSKLLFDEPLEKEIFLVGMRIVYQIGYCLSAEEIIVSNKTIQHGIIKEMNEGEL